MDIFLSGRKYQFVMEYRLKYNKEYGGKDKFSM